MVRFWTFLYLWVCRHSALRPRIDLCIKMTSLQLPRRWMTQENKQNRPIKKANIKEQMGTSKWFRRGPVTILKASTIQSLSVWSSLSIQTLQWCSILSKTNLPWIILSRVLAITHLLKMETFVDKHNFSSQKQYFNGRKWRHVEVIFLTHTMAHLYTLAWTHTFLFTCRLRTLSLEHGYGHGSVLGNGIAGCAEPHPDSLERKMCPF